MFFRPEKAPGKINKKNYDFFPVTHNHFRKEQVFILVGICNQFYKEALEYLIIKREYIRKNNIRG